MRKLFFICLACCMVNNIYSQTEESVIFGFDQNDFLATTYAGYFSQEDEFEKTKTNTFEIAPEVSYFITDHISLGLRANYQHSKIEMEEDSNESKETYIGGGVFGRYYFWPHKRFSLFGELGGNYSEITENNGGSTSFLELMVAPGINFFLSKRFIISAKIGAIDYSTSGISDGDEKIKSFSISLNPENLRFGFAMKF